MSYFTIEDVYLYNEGETPMSKDLYKAVHVTRLSLTSDITSHAVEDVEVSDHLILKPPAFNLELTLYDELKGKNIPADVVETRKQKFEKLRRKWISRTPLTFQCSFGTFHNMFINSLGIEELEETVTAYRVTLSLQMVVTAKIEEIVMTYIVDKDGAVAGVTATDIDFTQIGLTIPEKVETEDKSILERLWDWLF